MNTYDLLAADYHWLVPDEMLSGEWFLRRHSSILGRLPPEAKILDCSCGIGLEAIALAKHGYKVWASDGSKAMIAQAQRRAQEALVSLSFQVGRWESLAENYDVQFDLVLCTGNSIVHAASEDAMLDALCGMYNVMTSGATLILDSRNWEKLLLARPRITLASIAVERGGLRCIPQYIWTLPEERTIGHATEICLIFDNDGCLEYRRYELVFYPFEMQELVERLKTVGFADIETDWSQDADWYVVTARKLRSCTKLH